MIITPNESEVTIPYQDIDDHTTIANTFEDSETEELLYPTAIDYNVSPSISTEESVQLNSGHLEEKSVPDNDVLEIIQSEELIQNIDYQNQEILSENETDSKTLVPNEDVPCTTPAETVISDSDEENAIISKVESGSPSIEVEFATISEEKIKINFHIDTKIEQVKEKLASLFNINSEVIKLSFKGNECDDGVCLSDLGKPKSTLKFYIYSAKPKEFLSIAQFARYKFLKKNITVKIQTGDGCFTEINVEIENQCFFKEWHGGYINKKTNTVYHNKLVQTNLRRKPDMPRIYTRQTQTPVFPITDFASVTSKNKATQMWRFDHYIPSTNDKIVNGISARFRNSPSLHILFKIATHVTLLQRHFRNILAQRESIIEEKRITECFNNEKAERDMIIESLRKANRRQIIGTTFPCDRGDFYMMYLMVGTWWKKQMGTITKLKNNEARKAAVYDLLKQEIEFLYSIDKNRTETKKEIAARQELSFLETTARPIIFRNNKSNMASIDNVATQQAREYQEILASVLRKDVTVEQRINILQNLKCLIIDYDHIEYTAEIIDLINQECDLLRLGMAGKQLKSLRERTSQLLQFYLHDYRINPSAKTYTKPHAPKTIKTCFQCMCCKKLKPVNEYNVHSRMTAFNTCHSCEWLYNIGHERKDLSPYARILQQVRESEMKRCCYSSNCYVLQVVGMCYLTKRIWGDQSIISECNNLDQLRMVRFRQEEDWSPWNCILLTLEERAAHINIKNVETFYDKWLINKIHLLHMRARNEFLPLVLGDQFMCNSGLWFDVTDSGNFLHPSHITKFATSGDFEFLKD